MEGDSSDKDATTMQEDPKATPSRTTTVEVLLDEQNRKTRPIVKVQKEVSIKTKLPFLDRHKILMPIPNLQVYNYQLYSNLDKPH
jgi:hypothetical protein